jgi:hypothetical protein
MPVCLPLQFFFRMPGLPDLYFRVFKLHRLLSGVILFSMSRCSLPHCCNFVTTASSFDITSVTCWNCDHGFCSTCSTQNWRRSWTSDVFSKPCLTGPSLVHWLFICPLCRSGFDRITVVNEDIRHQ